MFITLNSLELLASQTDYDGDNIHGFSTNNFSLFQLVLIDCLANQILNGWPDHPNLICEEDEFQEKDGDVASMAWQDASSYGSRVACPSCKGAAFPFLEDNAHFSNKMHVFIAFDDCSYEVQNNYNQIFLLQHFH